MNDFLDKNILKVEKILDSFIQNINVAILSDDIFTLKISMKRSNYNKTIDNSSLIYLLNDAKDDCKESMKNKKIIHILIDNFIIDNILYQELPNNIKCETFSLDLRFISLSEDLVKK